MVDWAWLLAPEPCYGSVTLHLQEFCDTAFSHAYSHTRYFPELPHSGTVSAPTHGKSRHVCHKPVMSHPELPFGGLDMPVLSLVNWRVGEGGLWPQTCLIQTPPHDGLGTSIRLLTMYVLVPPCVGFSKPVCTLARSHHILSMPVTCPGLSNARCVPGPPCGSLDMSVHICIKSQHHHSVMWPPKSSYSHTCSVPGCQVMVCTHFFACLPCSRASMWHTWHPFSHGFLGMPVHMYVMFQHCLGMPVHMPATFQHQHIPACAHLSVPILWPRASNHQPGHTC